MSRRNTLAARIRELGPWFHNLRIDADPHYLRQARFASEAAGVCIDLWHMDVYEVGRLGRRFDLVIFMGVLYHLRHPLLALDLLHRHVVGEQMLFQFMQRGAADLRETAEDYPFSEWDIFNDPNWPKLHFIEHRYAGDPTNWFVPNRAAAEAMLRSAGFSIEAHPEPGVCLCRSRPGAGHAPPTLAPRWTT